MVPAFDQDGAAAITRRARKYRIQITSMGLLDHETPAEGEGAIEQDKIGRVLGIAGTR